MSEILSKNGKWRRGEPIMHLNALILSDMVWLLDRPVSTSVICNMSLTTILGFMRRQNLYCAERVKE